MTRYYRAWVAKTIEERNDFDTYEEAKEWALKARAKYGDFTSEYYFDIDPDGYERGEGI